MEDDERLKFRVRSMSWAPRARPPRENKDQYFDARNGAFFMAVANDDGDVSFLLVSSPYTNMSASWNCTVLKLVKIAKDTLISLPHGQAHAHSTRLPHLGTLPYDQSSQNDLDKSKNRSHFHSSLFKSALEGKWFIDHIAWGPWKFEDNAETIITFSRHGTIFHCLFEVQIQVSENGLFPQVIKFDCNHFLKQEIDGVPFSGCSAIWHDQVIIYGLALLFGSLLKVKVS